jgi:hypothetical protein
MDKMVTVGPIPMKTYVFFDAINVDNPKKKLLEFNAELAALSPAEIELLESFLELVKNKAFYHSSKVSSRGFEMLKKIIKLPADKVFPALDIYRMFLMHPHSADHFKVFEHGLEYLNILLSNAKSDLPATQLVALRCLVNLFNNSSSLYMLQQKR